MINKEELSPELLEELKNIGKTEQEIIEIIKANVNGNTIDVVDKDNNFTSDNEGNKKLDDILVQLNNKIDLECNKITTKFITIGDRDGLVTFALNKCVNSIKLKGKIEIVHSHDEETNTVGDFNLKNQETIKQISTKNYNKIIVILGTQSLSKHISEILTVGDSNINNPLNNISLGLGVYHITDPEIKKLIDKDIYGEYIKFSESDMNSEMIHVKEIREQYSKYKI